MTLTTDQYATCECTDEQPYVTTPVRRDTAIFVVTTWMCDWCGGEVYADWKLKAV